MCHNNNYVTGFEKRGHLEQNEFLLSFRSRQSESLNQVNISLSCGVVLD
jgi:hypothetical protein